MVDQNVKNGVLDFLRKISIMSAAVVGENGPISTVLLFSVDDDFTFYFATRKNTYKSRALLKNSKISFSVWEHNMMMIQADGVVEQVVEVSEIEKILDSLSKSTAEIENFWHPVLRITEDDYIVFKLTPNWMQKLDLNNTTIHTDNNMFTQII